MSNNHSRTFSFDSHNRFILEYLAVIAGAPHWYPKDAILPLDPSDLLTYDFVWCNRRRGRVYRSKGKYRYFLGPDANRGERRSRPPPAPILMDARAAELPYPCRPD